MHSIKTQKQSIIGKIIFVIRIHRLMELTEQIYPESAHTLCSSCVFALVRALEQRHEALNEVGSLLYAVSCLLFTCCVDYISLILCTYRFLCHSGRQQTQRSSPTPPVKMPSVTIRMVIHSINDPAPPSSVICAIQPLPKHTNTY